MAVENEEQETIELTEAEVALASAELGEDPVEPEAEKPVAEEVEEEASEEPVEEEESEAEEPQEKEEPSFEFTEDDYELGLSYGLTREDVEELGSRETLEKFGKIYDGKILQEKRVQKQAKSKEVDEEAEQEQKEEVLEEASDAVKFDLSKVNLDEYDRTTQEVFKALDTVQKEVEVLRSRNVALEAQQENSTIEKFGRVLDGMDEEWYGKQYDESSVANVIDKRFMDRRIELAEAVDTLVAGYTAKGKTPPPLEVLIKNAHSLAYPDRTTEVKTQENKQKLKRQAAKKRGAGTRKKQRAPVSEPLDDEEAEIQRIMEATDESYRRMLDENN